MSNRIRVFVGTDRSQALAVKVLEHSIKRHTRAAVEVVAMQDLPVPEPQDPRNGQRTGFSFSRFCIPKLAGYKGKAIYMDADMLVFRDIEELWNIPFNGAKVVIQKEVRNTDGPLKFGAPKERIKQCAVMLLDCDQLTWRIEDIVAGMDKNEYDYAALMYHLCILKETEISYGVPFEWNSLEHYDESTCLIHYTDMATQPWVSCFNQHGQLWIDEVRLMLQENRLRMSDIEAEIGAGYFRPSLIRDLKFRHLVPKFLRKAFDVRGAAMDRLKGFKPHKDVYLAKKRRDQAIEQWKKSLQQASG